MNADTLMRLGLVLAIAAAALHRAEQHEMERQLQAAAGMAFLASIAMRFRS